MLEDLDGFVVGVGRENSFDGEAMLGHVAPVLVEDEVAEGVDNFDTVVGFAGLGNVGMMADHEIGAVVDEEVRELLLACGWIFLVLGAPMNEDDGIIDFGIYTLKKGTGAVVVKTTSGIMKSYEGEGFVVDGFEVRVCLGRENRVPEEWETSLVQVLFRRFKAFLTLIEGVVVGD